MYTGGRNLKKTFALLNEPLAYQLSVRIANLVARYGVDVINKQLEQALVEDINAFDMHAKGMLDRNMMSDEHIAPYVGAVQVVQYFGGEFVVDFWNEVYAEKAA